MKHSMRLTFRRHSRLWKPPVTKCYARVSEAARYSLLGGGKRVRAVLCIAACDMLGGDTTLAARYAAGREMLHC